MVGHKSELGYQGGDAFALMKKGQFTQPYPLNWQERRILKVFKKSIVVLIVLVILAGLFIGCASKQPAAQISLVNATVPLAGEAVTLRGSGFQPAGFVWLELAGTFQSPKYGVAHTNPSIWSGKSDASGNLEIVIPIARVQGAISVYGLGAGDYTLQAVQAGQVMASTSFKVQ